MPGAAILEVARFYGFTDGKIDKSKSFRVQFNPTTLSVRMQQIANTDDQVGRPKSSGERPAGPKLYQSLLTVELMFDSTRLFDQTRVKSLLTNDVQQQAKDLFDLVMPKPEEGKPFAPARVCFVWGKFLFEGTVTDFEETLRFFSNLGTPLRSTVKLTMKRDEAHWAAAAPKGPIPKELPKVSDPFITDNQF